MIVVGKCSEFEVILLPEANNISKIHYVPGTYKRVGVLNEKVVYRKMTGTGTNLYIYYNASSQNLNSGHWIVSTIFQSN